VRFHHRNVAGFFVALLGSAVLLTAGPAAAATPQLKLTVTPSADTFLPEPANRNSVYTIEVEDVGNTPTDNSEPIALQDVLPDGFSVTDVQLYSTGLNSNVERRSEADLGLHGMCPTKLSCEYPSGPLASSVPPLLPHQKLVMLVQVSVPAAASGSVEDVAKLSVGGAPSAEASAVNTVSPEPSFGFHGFGAPLLDSGANPYTQAGGHPYQYTTEFDFKTKPELRRLPSQEEDWGTFGVAPVRDPRNITADLPPGLLGNPQGVPRCPLADFFVNECEISAVVGFVGYRGYGEYQSGYSAIVPLFNLQPSGAYPGELGYLTNGGVPFFITARLRSGSDYGITLGQTGTPAIGLTRVHVTAWGVPAAHEHDAMRGKECSGAHPIDSWRSHFASSTELDERQCEANAEASGSFPHGGPAGVPPTPFLTMPSECSGAPLTTVGRYDSWQVPEEEARAAATDAAVDGCNELKFEPTIEARPTTNLGDAPSGFDFDLKLPQNENPEGVATPSLKEAVVTLPPGLVVNPASGAGLEGCSPAQIGLKTPVGTTPAHFTEEPAHCPDASKLGTVEVKTPLLHEPLGSIEPLPGRVGAVYLATPHQNPSGDLLAGYIVLEGEGIIIKLAGQFKTDPQTGQITASFLENPQTPFEEFKFHFFEGARGALRTPAVCGSYEVHSTLTPYSAPESGPPAEPSSEFETSAGPTGGACPTSAGQEPHSPVFHAGTESPQAGIYSPFSLKLVRQDGEQEIKGIETSLPEGLVGRLAGTSYCPDAALAAAAAKSGAAEQASPSCPASSEVGSVDVTAGAGPTPLDVPGKAYLAGPYKGAPLSLAIITPAVAGPFDLGTVVVRTALFVDPLTARITAKSDPIPTILEGIPLDVRSITLQISRPNFTLNPTNCEPLAITGTTLSALGASTALNQRFQVGGCPALPFKPSLKISLKGSTKHAGHPALEAAVTYPQGGPYANIASAQVSLPHSEFIDQGNLNKTCTKPVLLEGKCPATSVYGKAKAWTPLLEAPLEGPVYLVGGFGYKLPALVAELDGQIRVLLVGKVDSDKEKGIRNTFETVPDAPVSRFVLQMKGGKKYSLLENSENICRKPQKAKATFTAQSGKVVELEPTIANSCKGKGKKKAKGPKAGAGHGSARALLERLGGW
jgi:hypothetical protein